MTEIILTLPKLGRPYFPAGSDPQVQILPSAAMTVIVAPGTDADAVAAGSYGGRLALAAVGGGDTVPVSLGPARRAGTAADGSDVWHVPLLASPAERQLYDVSHEVTEHVWQTLAPHAVYFRRSWTDFGIAHLTDPHVARRADRFGQILRDLGHMAAAERVVNVNDRFRGFVRFANAVHAAGELDLLVATGDLVDYLFESDDDPAGLGNAGFLRDLILGVAPGPDFPDVEELRVPILMTPGNHDYRVNPYRLVFDLRMLAHDWKRVRNFSGIALLEKEARDLDNALYSPGATEVADLSPGDAESMIAIDAALRPFREALADPEPYVVELGPHRVVMLDSAHDVGGADSLAEALGKLVEQWWGSGDEDFATLTGGSPNCEGIDDAEYAAALAAIEAPDDGLVIVGLHAPLVNVWQGEYPYFLRETQRPALPQQAFWWAVAQSANRDPRYVREDHATWFAPAGEPEPAYLKRGDSQDLLDYGVSRGRTDDLLRALAGEGTRRRADVVLAGHTHHHDEVSLRRQPDGSLAFFLDFYTANPSAYYPAKFVGERVGDVRPDHTVAVERHTTYVEVEPEAIAGSVPHRMPWDAKHDWVVHVPPYADPLSDTADPREWWDRHKPLLLQTGALGLWENDQVSFAGARVLRVRANVIERVDFVPMERLHASGYRLSLAEASAPPVLRAHRHVERSRRFGSPGVVGAPGVINPGDGPVHSVVYRDRDGYLVELWDAAGSPGAGRLADRTVAPGASGDPATFSAGGTNVVLYRGEDGHVHSLYWRGTEAAGHDDLSGVAGAAPAAGDPSGYELNGGSHVFYRTADGHIEELYWVGVEPVGHGRITGYCDEPLAAGDPWGYPSRTGGGNVVLYRGVDGHVHSLYWSDGPTGHDNLSGYVGSPLAAGDPRGYHMTATNGDQVVYRGEDGHIHEIAWLGAAPAVWTDLVAAVGSPKASADPDGCYVPATNTKHVVYVGADGHIHDIAWVPNVSAPAWTDLTLAALAPPAAPVRPAVFAVPGETTTRVVYSGTDGHVHEIRWG